jgi:RNA polymerase sigma-70 factor (ECF subfamily)
LGRALVDVGQAEAATVEKASTSATPVGRPVPRGAAEPSDDHLVTAVRAGSSEHFDKLYARYFRRIYSFVYARIRSHADCEEIVQETFLVVFRSLDRYRGTASLVAWIYGIARNLLNNHVRSDQRRRERIELVDEERVGRMPAPDAASPVAELELDEYRRGVISALDDLSSWQTDIFRMRHVENLSIPEISRRTQRSSDSVRSSLFRVKRIFLEHAALSPGGARS